MPVPIYTGQVTAQTDPGKTPLTVTGRTSQSVDIFDVTLTPGGTKVLAVNATGSLLLNGSSGATFGLADVAFGSAGSSRTNVLQIGNGFTAGFSTLGTSGSAGGVTGSVLTVSNTISGVTTAKAAIDGSGNAGLAGALVLGGAATNGGGGTVSIGGTTASTATAGATQTVPATVLGYIIGNINGTTIKIPYFAN